jgi:hypothetical protein
MEAFLIALKLIDGATSFPILILSNYIADGPMSKDETRNRRPQILFPSYP